MKMKQTITIGLLMVAFVAIHHVSARLPPPEARRPSTIGSSSPSDLSSSSPSSPSESAKPDSSASNPAESSVSAASDSESSSDHDEFEDALQQSLRAFELLRRHLSRPDSIRWNPHVFYPPSFGMMSGSDEDSAEDPLRMFSPVFRPIFQRDPHFSFFPRMPELPLNRPSVQGLDPIAKGYAKINDTRFIVHGREYCQTTYEKVEDKGFGVFTSRIITAQPCDQETKSDRESPATDLPAAEDKKQDDRRIARPEVEREDQPAETPAAAGSNNREPNEIKPEITKSQESTTPAQPTTNSDVKPKEKSVENEISDKPAESSRPEPTITVNDGK